MKDVSPPKYEREWMGSRRLLQVGVDLGNRKVSTEHRTGRGSYVREMVRALRIASFFSVK